MTPDYIAKIVENRLENINNNIDGIGKSSSIFQYNYSIGLLETYLKRNFLTFIESELVYKWAKSICERRILFENYYRQFGFMIGSREDVYKKWQYRLY